MKKLIKFIVASLFFILLGSCSSSDENNVNNDEKKVISKITTRFLDYGDGKEFINTEVNNFIYSNGEVIKIEVSEDFCGTFSYVDSKIVSSSNCKNEADETIFSYNRDLLIKTSSDEVINELFYDSDKLKEIKTSYVTDNFTRKYSSKYYYTGNNVTTTNEEVFWKPQSSVTEYKYDKKNNPFKNHNLYIKLIWGAEFLGDNNIIEETLEDRVIKYTIIYDSENYPIKSTGIDQETGKLRTEFTYEYTKI